MTTTITTSRDYYASVESAARSLIQDYGVMPNDSDIYDAIHQRADSAVIYCSDCDDILRFSNNDNAAFEEMGSECIEGKTSVSEVNTVLAYNAYARDLRNALSEMDEDEAHALLSHVQCDDCGEWHDEASEALECCEEDEDESYADEVKA